MPEVWRKAGKRRGGSVLKPPRIRNPRLHVVVSSSPNVETESILANRPGWYGEFAPSGQRCVGSTWGRCVQRRDYVTTANGRGGTGRSTPSAPSKRNLSPRGARE